jgi:AcrR family transcriptional regulator
MSPSAGHPAAGGDEPGRVSPRIIDAAQHVMEHDGFAAATLERIAAAAGISRMTLHRRGVSKADILGALSERLESDYRAALWPALVSTGTGRDRLADALRRLCEVTERNLSSHEALSIHTRNMIYHEDDSRGLTRKVFVEPLERLLLDGAADGSLAVVDAEESATVLFNAVAHTYSHLRSGHRWPPARARDAVVGLVLNGVVQA